MKKVRTPEPTGFLDFWTIWSPHMRHTDGRGDAREAFRKHILMGAEPSEIIDGASGFFRFMQEKDKPYVPLAASWLNREAYPDWAAKERAFQARQQERTNVVSIAAPRGQTAFLRKYQEAGE